MTICVHTRTLSLSTEGWILQSAGMIVVFSAPSPTHWNPFQAQRKFISGVEGLAFAHSHVGQTAAVGGTPFSFPFVSRTQLMQEAERVMSSPDTLPLLLSDPCS